MNNNQNKLTNLQNSDLNNIKDPQAEVEYATRAELNIEANIRSETDQTIYNYFENSKKSQIEQIQEIATKLGDLDDLTGLADKVTELEGIIKNNNDKIINLENGIKDTNERVTGLEGIIKNNADKIIDLENGIKDTNEKITGLEAIIKNNNDKIIDLENGIKDTNERVTGLEEMFQEQITRLENEKNELNKKLQEAAQEIIDKESELEKLREELGNGDSKNIDLNFPNPPEFIVTDVISVKHFINNYLKDLVIEKMLARYSDSEYGKDYTIIVEGLEYNDLMNGKDLSIIVSAIPEGKLTGATTFEIKVTYIYNILQQQKFVEEFFQPAIPISLRNISEDKTVSHNVPNEIVKTKPLKILLNNKDFKELTFKVFAEMNAGSYWTDFQRSWQFIISGYLGTGQSNIGGDKIINSINNLYDNTSGYHNSIYQLIEKQLNESGVPCTVTKKWGRSLNGKTLHNLGNLTFEVAKVNLFDNEVIFTKSRQYYMMINFEININNSLNQFYRGVTLALTDNLELYPLT